jgi:hypothetical protein
MLQTKERIRGDADADANADAVLMLMTILWTPARVVGRALFVCRGLRLRREVKRGGLGTYHALTV